MTHRIPSTLHLIAFVVLSVCLVDCLPLTADTASRLKRGFRNNVGDRMAHGFGKRGGYSGHVSGKLSHDGQDRWYEDNNSLETPISSVEEFTKLMMSNQDLARIVVVKFLDVNGDDVITNGELFRPVNY